MAKKLTSGNGWIFEPANPGRDAAVESIPDAEQKATVKLEKRPKGKEATVVAGYILADADRKALAAVLRKSCGAGGSEAPGHIEVQGDHRDKVRKLLIERGWRVK